jgi:hypothetical protein
MSSKIHKNRNNAKDRTMSVRIGAFILFLSVFVAGCWPAPGASVAHTAAVLYTEGARQNTVSARLKVPPDRVFAAMIRIAQEDPDFEIIKRDDRRLLLEVAAADQYVSGQATDLGRGETLLFIWADARASGMSGRKLALEAVKDVCAELGVAYEIVGP